MGRPRMLLRGRTVIGDETRILSDVARVEISVAPGATLLVGDEVCIDQGASVGVTELVTIGNGVHVGRHVQIMDNNFHHLELERRDEIPPSRPVAIGDHVWIGPMSLVLPGATIGAHSVVAARSVVVGVIPPRSLAAGSPAQVVRSL